MHQRKEKIENDRIIEELDKKAVPNYIFDQYTLQANLIRLTGILSL